MKPLRTVVADDSDGVRSSIVALLRHLPEVSIVGEAKDGEEALKCVDELDPDLLVMPSVMRKLNGWQVLHHLQERQARTKVIFFTAYATPQFAAMVKARGVIAYLNKDNPQALGSAIRELAQKMNTESS